MGANNSMNEGQMDDNGYKVKKTSLKFWSKYEIAIYISFSPTNLKE